MAEAPCRVDLGGTLDIAPLALGLNRLQPATCNIALGLTTSVRAEMGDSGGLEVASAGFAPAVLGAEAPYAEPFGFFKLAADYFGLAHLRLTIASSSPPRAALGGSSAALVAAVAAMARLAGRRLARWEVVGLAHAFEEALFQIPCGRQDHLAAAYGGARLWTWTPGFKRGWHGRQLLRKSGYPSLESRLVVVYPGETHVSADVNGRWIRGFVAGQTRAVWREIISLTRRFARSVEGRDWAGAAACLDAETRLRLDLTPEVLTPLGRELFEAARSAGAGARFCGAGGGGCLWALGEKAAVDRLREAWAGLVAGQPGACFLPGSIDRRGLTVRAES